MAIYSQKLAEFPGFGLYFDPEASPYFRTMVTDDLRKIKTKPIGAGLLVLISKARPRFRTIDNGPAEARAISFPDGVNVIFTPTSMAYMQSGYKKSNSGPVPSANPAHNPDGCRFYPSDGGQGCRAVPANITAAEDGNGCVSRVLYTNAQCLTAKGEATHSFIVLAHELIHSLNQVYGRRHPKDEELRTTGLGIYSNEERSENKFRAAFGLPPRIDH
ncbi:MAG: M91 family zinc metallopeptidase [Aliidongia sp.]